MACFPVAQISKKFLAATAIAALCTASAMANPCAVVVAPEVNPINKAEAQLRYRAEVRTFQDLCAQQQMQEREAARVAAARREAKIAAEAAAEVEAAETAERQRKEAEADAARQLVTAKRLAAQDAERRQQIRKHEAELRVIAEEQAKHEAEEQQAAAQERQIAEDERAKREADAAAIRAVEQKVAAEERAKRLAAEESERSQRAQKYETELRAAEEERAKREAGAAVKPIITAKPEIGPEILNPTPSYITYFAGIMESKTSDNDLANYVSYAMSLKACNVEDGGGIEPPVWTVFNEIRKQRSKDRRDAIDAKAQAETKENIAAAGLSKYCVLLSGVRPTAVEMNAKVKTGLELAQTLYPTLAK